MANRDAVRPVDVRGLLANLPPQAKGVLSNYEPSLRERAGWAVGGLLARLGADKHLQRYAANKVGGAIDLVPGIGDVVGVDDAYQDYKSGNLGMAAAGLGLAALGVVPGVGDAVSKTGKKGIRAFHGSPHDFDRFSLDKIGTGEGAQAYGHGLYFAESEGVAKSYRDTLSGGIPQDAIKSANVSNDVAEHARALLAQTGDAAEVARRLRASAPRSYEELRPDMLRLAEILDATAGNRGRMYEVNINADPEDFLDWDKPLRDQPAIAERLGVDPYARLKQIEEIERNVIEDMRAAGRVEPDEIDLQNMRLAERLSSEYAVETAGSYAPRGPEMAQELLSKGIPGIKYKDYGSRNLDSAESGTRNYVVFDDKLIDIVKKYGIAAALSAGLISQQMAEQMQAQGMEL